MIKLTFARVSVCMGDDVNAGKYELALDDDATLGMLIDVILYGGCGNERPIPYTGANSF